MRDLLYTFSKTRIYYHKQGVTETEKGTAEKENRREVSIAIHSSKH